MRTTLRRARALGTLGWWLGVRGTSEVGPTGVRWRQTTTDLGLRLWTCEARSGRDGRRSQDTAPVLLIAPGLHMDGPSDRRMQRLGAIFAAAGATVVMPHLDAFEALWIRADRHPSSAAAQLIAASDWARRHFPGRPQVAFSVSFGAAPLLHLVEARELERAVIFGGFATLQGALLFALDRRANPNGDPLNGPAIYRNLADVLVPPAERAAFEAACLAFCAATWSRSERPALKRDRRFAHALADATRPLSPLGTALLHEATGLSPGAVERVQTALQTFGAADSPFAWAEPLTRASRVSTPMAVIHGRDDDVIPHTEGEALRQALPNATLHLSGSVGHTAGGVRPGAVGELASALGALAHLISG